jgi:hypothetical protein
MPEGIEIIELRSAKAIGSNPLAGFLVQKGCREVAARDLGDWGKRLELRRLITG